MRKPKTMGMCTNKTYRLKPRGPIAKGFTA